MLKLSNQILDIYDDADSSVLEALSKIRPDCYVKTAEERSQLRDHEFALTLITKKASKLNKYPISDADSTWLSDKYFELNHHKLPVEAQIAAAHSLKMACDKFSLTPSACVVKIASSSAKPGSNVYFEKEGALRPTIHVKSVDMSKLAEIDSICDNESCAQYAMPTPSAVKIACEYFKEHQDKMPVLKRHKYAAAIQKRAHELGMPAQKGAVEKYASDHYSGMVDAHLRARAALVDHKPELKDMYTKMASAKKQYSPSQFAQILYGIDKQAGLDNYYGAHLQNPFHATFGSEPDMYAGFRYKSASAAVLEGDELKNLATVKYAKVKEYFGDSFAGQFKTHPLEVFDSLPKDAKEVLVGIANGTH